MGASIPSEASHCARARPQPPRAPPMAEVAPLSFGLRGQTFRVGDCVALLPPPGSEEPYVARSTSGCHQSCSP